MNIKRVKGEPLAGTKAWCEMHSLQYNPDLKRKVLQSLKISPGSAIFVGGVCIYLGEERHFTDHYPPRGRMIESSNIKFRSRSMSPGRDLRPPKPQRPGQNLPPSGMENIPAGTRTVPPLVPKARSKYRERSPLRAQDNSRFYHDLDYINQNDTELVYDEPEYQTRAPRYDEKSNAVVFEPMAGFQSNRLQVPQPKVSQLKENPRELFPFHQSTQASRPALGEISNAQQNRQNTQGQEITKKHAGNSSNAKPIFTVDDPHFVLNVTENASEEEIAEAYQDMIWELERERSANPGLMLGRAKDIWEESIEWLNAAKRQLLGY